MNVQGGSPCGNNPADNHPPCGEMYGRDSSGFNSDGSLRIPFFQRLEKIITRADGLVCSCCCLRAILKCNKEVQRNMTRTCSQLPMPRCQHASAYPYGSFFWGLPCCRGCVCSFSFSTLTRRARSLRAATKLSLLPQITRLLFLHAHTIT